MTAIYGFDDLREKVLEFSRQCRKSSPDDGIVVYPGGAYERSWYLTVDRALYEDSVTIPVLAVGCVIYKIRHDDRLHQSMFVYAIGTRNGPHWDVFRPEMGGVPIEMIKKQVFSWGIAD